MTNLWARWDDWPSPAQLALYEALRSIPGADTLSDTEVDGYARLLATAAELGRGQEMPRFRGASHMATDRQLMRLHKLADNLAQHIEDLNGPALRALGAEGSNAIDFLTRLRDFEENARCAYSEGPAYSEAADASLGRPKKIEAAQVTETAAEIFERVSGRRPTFTTDPATSEVSGDWPRFLGRVFDALYIPASVASQVKAFSQKTPPKV